MLTQRQLDGLIKRHERSGRDREFLFAQLTAEIVNTRFGYAKEPCKPTDFMPSEWAKIQQAPKRNNDLIAEELRQNMLALSRGGMKVIERPADGIDD